MANAMWEYNKGEYRLYIPLRFGCTRFGILNSPRMQSTVLTIIPYERTAQTFFEGRPLDDCSTPLRDAILQQILAARITPQVLRNADESYVSAGKTGFEQAREELIRNLEIRAKELKRA